MRCDSSIVQIFRSISAFDTKRSDATLIVPKHLVLTLDCRNKYQLTRFNTLSLSINSKNGSRITPSLATALFSILSSIQFRKVVSMNYIN